MAHNTRSSAKQPISPHLSALVDMLTPVGSGSGSLIGSHGSQQNVLASKRALQYSPALPVASGEEKVELVPATATHGGPGSRTVRAAAAHGLSPKDEALATHAFSLMVQEKGAVDINECAANMNFGSSSFADRVVSIRALGATVLADFIGLLVAAGCKAMRAVVIANGLRAVVPTLPSNLDLTLVKISFDGLGGPARAGSVKAKLAAAEAAVLAELVSNKALLEAVDQSGQLSGKTAALVVNAAKFAVSVLGMGKKALPSVKKDHLDLLLAAPAAFLLKFITTVALRSSGSDPLVTDAVAALQLLAVEKKNLVILTRVIALDASLGLENLVDLVGKQAVEPAHLSAEQKAHILFEHNVAIASAVGAKSFVDKFALKVPAAFAVLAVVVALVYKNKELAATIRGLVESVTMALHCVTSLPVGVRHVLFSDVNESLVLVMTRYLAVFMGPVASFLNAHFDVEVTHGEGIVSDAQRRWSLLADPSVDSNKSVLDNLALSNGDFGRVIRDFQLVWSRLSDLMQRFKTSGIALPVVAPAPTPGAKASGGSGGGAVQSPFYLAVLADRKVGKDVAPVVGGLAYTDSNGVVLNTCKFYHYGAIYGTFKCTIRDVSRRASAFEGTLGANGSLVNPVACHVIGCNHMGVLHFHKKA